MCASAVVLFGQDHFPTGRCRSLWKGNQTLSIASTKVFPLMFLPSFHTSSLPWGRIKRAINYHLRALFGIIEAVFLTFVDVSSTLGAVKRLGACLARIVYGSKTPMSAVEQAELDNTQENQGGGEVTAQDAGRLLGIGHAKLSRLLRAWERTGQGLPYRRSRLDQRAILISRKDIAALREQSQGVSVQEAMRRLGVSRQKMKRLIESGELPLREN